MISQLFILLHPFIVHVAIVSILFAFSSSLIALLLSYIRPHSDYIEKFGFSSYLLLVISLITIPLSIISGYIDAGSLDSAANNSILSFKIRLSFILMFIIISPLTIKIYTNKLLGKKLFIDETLFTLMYVGFLLIATVLIFLIGALGGYYTYNHSFLDNLGLGYLLIDSIPTNYRINLFNSILPSVAGILVYILIIAIPFVRRK